MSKRKPSAECKAGVGGRARALLLCVLTVGLTTGASDCGLIDILIQILSARAYGTYEQPEPSPPPEPARFGDLIDLETFTQGLADGGRGESVAVGNELILTGEPRDRDGEARIERADRPTSDRPLLAPLDNSRDGTEFGASVAALGATAFVGAPSALSGEDPRIESGAVFLFDYPSSANPAALAGRIDPPAPFAGERFGAVMDADGTRLVVRSEAGGETGAVHVYQRSGDAWSHEQTLEAPVQAADFGRSLAISGNRIVVGDPLFEGSGAIHTYVLAPGGWRLDLTTRSPVPQFGAEFGDAVDLDGSTMVVGAPSDSDFRGAAYVFTRLDGFWVLQQRLAEDPERAREGELFGDAVAVEGNRIVVGIPLLSFKGGIAVFDRSASTWTRSFSVSPIALEDSALFGKAVATAGGIVVVGAPGFAGGEGAAFVYGPAASKRTLAPAKRSKAPRNTYLGFRPPRNADGPLTGELELPRSLWAPFRAELRAGVFDESLTTGLDGSAFCIGVRSSEQPGATFEVVGTFTADGLDLQARTHAGPVGMPLALPDTQLVDVGIARDAAGVVLSVRPVGESSFRELARIDTGPQSAALFPFIRSERVPVGAEIGYDDPLVESGPSATPQAPERTLRDQAFDALTATVAAGAPLETGAPDSEAARTAVDDAIAKVEIAVATARGILEPTVGKRRSKTGPKPALKQLTKAAKKLSVARKKLERGKSAKAVLKQIGKARKFELKALQALSD